MDINLSFDTRAAAAPASFRTAMQAAANLLDATFVDNITVTLAIGYGDYPADGSAEPSGGASSNSVFGALPYSQVRSWLSSNAAAAVQSGISAFPTTATINGSSYIPVSYAQAKLMGQMSNAGSEIDGYAGFATNIAAGALVGVAIHELTHALGRVPQGADIFDLFRYTSPGTLLFTNTIPAAAAYFSLDGGKTDLANYGQLSDPSDFKNSSATQGDPFDESYSASTLQGFTALDTLQMEALGFHLTATTTTTATATFSASPAHTNDLSYAASASGSNHFIDLVNFEAGFPDLIQAFGSNTQAMATWYTNQEPVELRVGTFNGLDYVASNPDLIKAFAMPGTSQAAIQDAGASHYIADGMAEGRSTTFNALDYIASYADLSHAFGNNADAGAMQFIQNGATEGRTTSFDGLNYIAGYSDLMIALGSNEQAGASHFLTSGILEGRSSSFNAQAYVTAHPDLQGAYSTNDQFLTAYINTYVQTGHYLT